MVQKQVAVEKGRDVVIGDIEPLSNLPLGLSALTKVLKPRRFPTCWNTSGEQERGGETKQL